MDGMAAMIKKVNPAMILMYGRRNENGKQSSNYYKQSID